MDIPYIIGAGLNPILGIVVDRFLRDHRYFVILLGSLIMVLANIICIVLPDCDKCWYAAIPSVLLGISYSISSTVLYPQISLVCDPNVVGTAYGILAVLCNIGNAILGPVMGIVEESTLKYAHGFFWIEVMFLVLSVLTSVCNILSIKFQNKE